MQEPSRWGNRLTQAQRQARIDHRPMPVSGTDGQRRASCKPLVATAERRRDRYRDFIEIDNDPG